MIKIYRLLVLVLLLPFAQSVSQIKIVELPFPELNELESSSKTSLEFRQIIPLMSDWNVYVDESKENINNVNLPCYFENGNKLIFEKDFELGSNYIKNFLFELHCNGINYSAEVLLNDVVVFKDDVAGLSFNLPLTNELLKSSEPNNLRIIVTHELDDENTLPPVQRFLFPKNRGGIAKEVYILATPVSNISLNSFNSTNVTSSNAKLNYSFTTKIDKPAETDSTSHNSYSCNFTLVDPAGNSIISESFSLNNYSETIQRSAQLRNPALWSNQAPNNYIAQFQLLKNNEPIDEISKKIVLADFEVTDDKIKLNGNEFEIVAVTYINNNFLESTGSPYNEIRKDLQTAKSIGFNTIRFAKSLPDAATISICSELGLLAFVELPVHSLPESFATESSYKLRSKNLLKKIADNLFNEQVIAAVGLGTSYLSESGSHKLFLEDMGGYLQTLTDKPVYASFIGNNFSLIQNIDLYGLEIKQKDLTNTFAKEFKTDGIVKSHIFISEATYPNYYGSRSGYLFKYSLEAQAKFFEDVINYSKAAGLGGFCLNTLRSYSGDYASLYTQHSQINEYSIGIVDEVNNPNRITYKVINAKLSGAERVTIPIGSAADDSPIFIIFAGLALALMMAILINSKKKFREDSTRALFRPYNFYADIRDQRILSGFHTVALMIILTGAHALLLTNVLFYLKDNVFLEKALLAFAQPIILDSISYLAWNPLQAFIYCYIMSIVGFFILAFFIKIFSFFIKTRVHFFNTYFVVVWAFLPLALLLPVKLILYRVLVADILNLYIYIFLVLYLVWIIQRIVKGVYVIFDTSKYTVYFYSLILLVLTLGSTVAIFQLSYSSIDYLITVFKQYPLF